MIEKLERGAHRPDPTHIDGVLWLVQPKGNSGDTKPKKACIFGAALPRPQRRVAPAVACHPRREAHDLLPDDEIAAPVGRG